MKNYNFNKEFCSFKQSSLLEEIGFNEPCLGFYIGTNPNQVIRVDSDDFISTSTKSDFYDTWDPHFDVIVTAPLLQQAFRFFTSKGIYNDVRNCEVDGWIFKVENKNKKFESEKFETHSDCVQACLDYLISFFMKEEKITEIKNFLKDTEFYYFEDREDLITQFLDNIN